MSIFIKPGVLKVRDDNDEFSGINIMAEESSQNYLAAIQNKGEEVMDAIEEKGEETIDSIPSDYTALTNEVEGLKEDLKSTIEANQDLIDADIKAAGYVTGLNFVPPLWEAGGINSSGNYITNTKVRSKLFIPVIPSRDIVFISDHTLSQVYVVIYDSAFTFISRLSVKWSQPTTLPANAAYVKLYSDAITYGTTVKLGLAYASTAQTYQDYTLSSPELDGLSLASPSAQSEAFDISVSMTSGAYIKYDGEIRSSSGFFYTSSFTLHKNEGFLVTAKGSGSSILWMSKWTSDGVFIEAIALSTNVLTSVLYIAKDDTEYIRFSNNTTSSTYSFDVQKITMTVPDAFPYAVKDYLPKKHKITVGTGKMFTSFVDAIASIADSSEDNQYVIEVYPGTYETVVAADIEEGYKGLIIPDWVSIIGIGNRDSIIIKGTLPDASYAEYANDISTLNLTMNGTVENVTIKSKNLRYCNHDDGTDSSIPGSMIDVHHTFHRVKWICESTDSWITATAYCVGIGSQKNKEVVFEDCDFINENANKTGILMHDNAANSQVNGGRLYVKNCIFNLASGCNDVRLSNSGGSMESYAYLIGNAFTSGVVFTSANASITTNVWKMFATGNKNYSLTKKSGMVDVDLSVDITEFNNIATA